MKDDLKMFGYYLLSSDKEKYLQVRCFIKLNFKSEKLNLKTNESEVSKDSIVSVKAFYIDEALKLIPWLRNSGEYLEFKRKARE
jgi:hypothetical protein